MPDREEFAARTEPYRRELLAHCYRMLGSVDEAEDLVQETYLRAWRSYGDFRERSSVRTWLYRIATNACLNALEHSSRRVLPSGLGAPGDDPYAEPVLAGQEVRWLQPLVTPEETDPALIVAGRETLRLALVASLQYLPSRQRAVLILREVLGFPAVEVAAMLETSVAAVKSTLQRARANLAAVDEIVEPTDPAAKELLDQYVYAFEHSDPAALEQALRTDAVLEMVPARTWFAGIATCLPYLRQVLYEPGDWRMTRTCANGQPAVLTYFHGEFFGVAVLGVTATGIARITLFGAPYLPKTMRP